MSSLATFCDVPVSTSFDARAYRSCVSLDWVLNSGLRTRASQLSGPLTLACDMGIMSMHLHDVAVTASLPCDLMLGLDWLHVVRTSAQQPVVHLGSGSLDLRTIGSMLRHSPWIGTQWPMYEDFDLLACLLSASPPTAPVFQANIGVELSASSASAGGPDGVLAPSSMPRTRSVGVVAASTVAAGMPRTREVHTSRSRDGMSGQDVLAASTLAAPPPNLNYDDLNINDDDPFVRISADEKIAVVRFLIHNQQIVLQALRVMTGRHQHVSLRDSNEKRKSADTLRSEFLAHECSEACLILRSEAMLVGLNPPLLTASEIQRCWLLLGSRKRKAAPLPENSRKAPRLSFDTTTSSTTFPILLSQSEKDKIVCEYCAATGNKALQRHECSFCGKLEFADCIRLRAINELDISLLDRAAVELRVRSSLT